MKREDKVTLICVSAFNVFFWFFFVFILYTAPGVPVWPDEPTHALDTSILNAYLSHATLRSIVYGMRVALLIVDCCELYVLRFHKTEPNGHQILPISSKEYSLVLLATFVLYLPCRTFVNRLAGGQFLWKLLLPELFISVAFFVIVGIGVYKLRVQQSNVKDD